MTAAALTTPLPRYSGKEDPRDALPFFLWSTLPARIAPGSSWAVATAGMECPRY